MEMSNRIISSLIIITVFTKDMVICDNKICEIWRKTVKTVQSCPSNREEMEEFSRRKNCKQYNINMTKEAELNNNCTDYTKIQLLYHCVINTFGNQTIEVCAPKKRIHGFCTEFSEEFGKVQANNYLDCTTFVPPCKNHYDSTDAYLYKNCYNSTKNQELIKNLRDGSIKQTQPKNVTPTSSPPGSDLPPFPEIIGLIQTVTTICIVILLTVMLIVFGQILKYVRYKLKKKRWCKYNGPLPQSNPGSDNEDL